LVKILITKEVAEALRVSEDYVRELCRSGKLKCYKEGRRGGFRIEESEVEKYIKRKLRSVR